ncbi:hypothetical protein LIA77_08894 [Sarocladium implicatum]|nr:hypothetical protein LIA77_08894 [Sarocladium implicatum]
MSTIENCITPPLDCNAFEEEVSPLSPHPILVRHHSSQTDTSEDATLDRGLTSPKRPRWKSRRNTEPHVPRLNTAQPRHQSADLDRIFTPRPLDVLLAERAYLNLSLHRQNLQSRQLICEYSALEQEFCSPELHGKARRRLRKRLGHLRSHLETAARQERAIFISLGEVYTELESHTAWSEAALWRIPLQHQQRHGQQAGLVDTNEQYFPGYTTPLTPVEACVEPQNTPLDPKLPEFVPGQPIYACSESSSAVRFTSDLSTSSALETVDETSEDECISLHGIDGVVQTEDLDELADGHEDDGEPSQICSRRTSHEEAALSPREKRLSLPIFPSAWPFE